MQWFIPNGSVGTMPRAWEVQRALRRISKVTPTGAGAVRVRGVRWKAKDGIF